MTWLLAFLLLLAVAAYVTYPLLRPPQKREKEEAERELLSRKETLLSAIKELQFDYELGNLSPKEHRELEEKYEARALSVLRELDHPSPSREGEVEREIAALRRAAKERRFCSRCGDKADPGDSFCSRCGASLQGEKT